MASIYVALGSNLGDRAAHLFAGLAGCAAGGLRLAAVSHLYETAPAGCEPGQPNYYNAVAAFESGLDAVVVLRILQRVEAGAGRERGARNAPRTLDLDLLVCGDAVRCDSELILPHPRLHERLFVLEPWADIAPRLVVPRLGRTVLELRTIRRASEPPGSVRKVD